MLEKLSFEIQETPVLYSVDGKILTSGTHKVITKETGEPISVMKNSYNPMYNKDFTSTVERMQEISGFKLMGYSEFSNGQIVMAHLENNLKDFSIGGNKINDYLILGSSFDGRYPFFIGTSTLLIRCQNQFSRINQVERVKHTKSSPKRREELMHGLEVYFSDRNKMYKNFEKLTNVKITPEIHQLVVDYVMSVNKTDRLEGKISTRKLNQLEMLELCINGEIKDLGENMWALFNGVTKYTTHELKSKENSFGNLFGTANYINQRAFNTVLEYVS
jgi:hypothetical protein